MNFSSTPAGGTASTVTVSFAALAMFSLVTGAILHDRSYTVLFTVLDGARLGLRPAVASFRVDEGALDEVVGGGEGFAEDAAVRGGEQTDLDAFGGVAEED